MSSEKPLRRMTLRQLLTHSEKSARDLAEHLQAIFLARVSDFRDLSRPVRRRSHYPTLLAISNALKKLEEFGDEAQNMMNYLNEHLQIIQEHANRERISRQ